MTNGGSPHGHGKKADETKTKEKQDTTTLAKKKMVPKDQKKEPKKKA
ncbi:hypothetical protein GobsT_25530 [Gemmata obscuriglobus]|nr:hypothetical protein [Gemmata obscuriglobus]QEG27789.1 hypothetical protein GobsT_25530 [Gemmata obscuriglobus]VTS05104.1 unnamed protein product [Gemmata obscuriglobus UQM 2246]